MAQQRKLSSSSTGAAPTAPTAPPSARSTVVRIRALLPSLAPAAPACRPSTSWPIRPAVAGLTITELSEACGVSETSTVRFCRAIGFRGYSGLRLRSPPRPAGPREAGSAARSSAATSPRPTTSARSSRRSPTPMPGGRGDRRAARRRDARPGRSTRWCAARRVDVYGVGASAFVALRLPAEAAPHRTRRVRLVRHARRADQRGPARPGRRGGRHLAHRRHPRHHRRARRGAAGTVPPPSRSPTSRVRRSPGPPTTCSPRPPARRRSAPGAMASRLAQLTVVDCVFVGVAQRTYPDTRSALETHHERPCAAAGSRPGRPRHDAHNRPVRTGCSRRPRSATRDTLDIDLRSTRRHAPADQRRGRQVPAAVRAVLPALAEAVDLAADGAARRAPHPLLRRRHVRADRRAGRGRAGPDLRPRPGARRRAPRRRRARRWSARSRTSRTTRRAGRPTAADVRAGDVAIGLTASGRTPYVVGALRGRPRARSPHRADLGAIPAPASAPRSTCTWPWPPARRSSPDPPG